MSKSDLPKNVLRSDNKKSLDFLHGYLEQNFPLATGEPAQNKKKLSLPNLQGIYNHCITDGQATCIPVDAGANTYNVAPAGCVLFVPDASWNNKKVMNLPHLNFPNGLPLAQSAHNAPLLHDMLLFTAAHEVSHAKLVARSKRGENTAESEHGAEMGAIRFVEKYPKLFPVFSKKQDLIKAIWGGGRAIRTILDGNDGKGGHDFIAFCSPKNCTDSPSEDGRLKEVKDAFMLKLGEHMVAKGSLPRPSTQDIFFSGMGMIAPLSSLPSAALNRDAPTAWILEKVFDKQGRPAAYRHSPAAYIEFLNVAKNLSGYFTNEPQARGNSLAFMKENGLLKDDLDKLLQQSKPSHLADLMSRKIKNSELPLGNIKGSGESSKPVSPKNPQLLKTIDAVGTLSKAGAFTGNEKTFAENLLAGASYYMHYTPNKSAKPTPQQQL